MLDERLKEYATPTQAKYLDATNKLGSMRKAADSFGVHESVLRRALKSLGKKAALQGVAPAYDMVTPVPQPFNVKGVSTLYDGQGNVTAQWVKTQLNLTLAREAIEEYVEWLVQEVKGTSAPIAAPKRADSDLLCVYPMGDPHFGMYAWAQECGADFDTEIAERLTKAAIDRLVACAPDAETAMVLELGDFFHADDSKSRTPQSGYALDTDTRWARVMQVGLRAMTYVVQKTLARHKKVIVRIVAGNHDPHSSFALALALDAFFSNNDRVTVDLSASPFWYYRFGKVLIGSTHGDTVKMDKLPGIMAADKPREWGETEYRYWYLGHVHHQEIQEYPGCVAEKFRTLAARDAWHTGAGYRAGRDMRLIVHHKDYGEIERHRCDIAQIEDKK
jgi:NAD(P)-dependent dehydrogenase (short-subunit alcohol dehydrogenase family)